jgi:hypothetical protein
VPIVVVCPGCGKSLRAPDTLAGKTVRCPGCKTAVRLVSSSSNGKRAKEQRATARRRQLKVALPANWYEVPGQSPRAYRREGERTGWLRVSFYPPLGAPTADDASSDEDAAALLSKRLSGLGVDLGMKLVESHGPCDAGMMATSVWRSAKQGLQQFWLIPAEVSVFATYTAGNLQTAKEEMAEAHVIMKTVHFCESEG